MTGVIYLVIIALWAAVLIPMWLRRHDQISEVRSTARFSTAMRSLGNHDDDVADSRVDGDRPHARTRPVRTQPVSSRERAAREAATRRAIVLAGLTLLLAGSLVGFLLGAVPVWLLVAAAVLLAGFVFASAATASQRSGVQRTARPAARPVAREPRNVRPERAAAEGRQAPVVAVEDDWETWNAWDDEEAWEPVPATLPTYVSAPRASAIPRPIDRAAEGDWNGQAMVQAAQAMRDAETEAAAEAKAEFAAVADARLADDPDAMFDGRSGVTAEPVSAGDVTAEIPVIPYTDRRVVGA